MKEKPKKAVYLAALFFVIAAAMPVQIMMLFGHSVFDVSPILHKLTPMNWVVILLALVNGIAVFHLDRWTLVTGPLFALAVIWNNILVESVGGHFITGVPTMASLALLGLFYHVFDQKVLTLLYKPSLRWWRAAERHKVGLTVSVRPVSGGDLESRSVDLSTSGVFVGFHHSKWDLEGERLGQFIQSGARCSLRLKLNQTQSIHCTGEIVRVSSRPQGDYPSGFAIRFTHIAGADRRLLGHFLEELPPGTDLPDPSSASFDQAA